VKSLSGIVNEIRGFIVSYEEVSIKCEGVFLMEIDQSEKHSNNDSVWANKTVERTV